MLVKNLLNFFAAILKDLFPPLFDLKISLLQLV